MKIPIRTRTDRDLSIEATEFLWDEDGLSEVHGLVLKPILRMLRHHAAKRVLDIGCGNGTFSSLLAAEGFSVAGVDSSSSGIAIARQAYPHLEFSVHDISQPLPGGLHASFDAVISVEVIEHLFQPRALFRRATEALNSTGLFVVTTPYHGYLKNLAIALLGGFDRHVHPLRDYGHIKFFSVNTLRQLVEGSGFVVEDVSFAGRIKPLSKSMILSARSVSRPLRG